MRTSLISRCVILGGAISVMSLSALAQNPAGGPSEQAAPSASNVRTVEISPANVEVEVGQELKFAAVGKDATGQLVDEKPATWFAHPGDVAAADDLGTVTFFGPGRVRVGAIIGGKTGYATVIVKPAPVALIEVEAPAQTVVVGGGLRLRAVVRAANRDPRTDVAVSWSSANPSIAAVDPAGVVTGISVGRAKVEASAGGVKDAVTIEVVKNPVAKLSIEPRSASVRTGDVVRFVARALDSEGRSPRQPSVTWSVSSEGAFIEPDGGFVAERPGSYIVSLTSGDRAAFASVAVTPRNVARELEVVGRVPLKDVQTAEQWIFGNYAYLSTLSDRLIVYDITDPANPKHTDTVSVNARVINDVSTTADGRVGVLTREGASNRRNGLVFLDTSEPSHPRVVSEFTDTVTGGVHSAFVDSHYVYLTDDATGSMRVIDFQDVRKPKEVARWEVEIPNPKTITRTTGEMAGERFVANRSLHDVYVKDGLAYLAYWRDGLVILDVGSGTRGGRPEKPQFVSQLRFNYHELYGDDWLAGAHSVFRYKQYLFVGDEVFPGSFTRETLNSRERIAVKGIVHVIDVSDLTRPRKVAEYVVPEAGAHNMWVEDDVLYMGYYNGGGRVLDVSGELRGDLYRQGREIARLWTGDTNGFRPNLPLAWGAQPHKGLIFFNDINTGLWITRLKPAAGQPTRNQP